MIPYPEVLSRIPFEDLEALDELSVRFTFPHPRAVPPHWAMVLDERPDLDRLEPEVGDREAVAAQLQGLRQVLLESFERGKGSTLFTSSGIVRPEQWRDVLLDHYCRPRWLYTNAQRVFTLVLREGPRYEVAELPSLSSLHEFLTLQVRQLPDPREVVDFGHRDAAEAQVLHELARVQMLAIPLRRGDRRRTLLLQAAGNRPGFSDYDIELHVARVGDHTALLEMEPGRRDAYTVLNRLGEHVGRALDGDVVEACATCSGFRFSGMIRDSSGGARGYCRRRLEEARASGRPMSGLDTRPTYGTIVSVFDRCPAYEAITDEDREVEFCLMSSKSGAGG